MLQARLNISYISIDILLIYRISVMFDMISAIDNRLMKKSAKNR